jgi:hypothetical protein
MLKIGEIYKIGTGHGQWYQTINDNPTLFPGKNNFILYLNETFTVLEYLPRPPKDFEPVSISDNKLVHIYKIFAKERVGYICFTDKSEMNQSIDKFLVAVICEVA